MSHKLTKEVWHTLACPYCSEALEAVRDSVHCSGCDAVYHYSAGGPLDLRLPRPRTYSGEFRIGVSSAPEYTFPYTQLTTNEAPEVNYDQVSTPRHLSKQILSYFPKARSGVSLALDIGCGTAIHKEVCEKAGFTYVGLDYNCDEASILGDAHALPFKDGSFDFLLSIAALEHMRYPHIMMKEAYRVLKPGGRFVGTVSFLEPFHDYSYYHHSHLGLFNSLHSGGFEVERISPNDNWSVLFAQAKMILFPNMPSNLARTLVLPVHVLHRLWWLLGGKLKRKDVELKRQLSTAGAFTFIALRN
ncbi:class I SAM-dependent methyltransferase [Geomobilimonas luticola]|uniref:Methyltransferase domain-containing protein n=1 Tax=Geomobilimonas luticola TaxID=1114878 RepID=A0ABS5SE93_9BACT|nr:class I SAM-dependent methyltransferase [Geomobilimonas luticola]MBT0652936.1 methyltransferase domain-containing protein [Geomobilimonas luticola]